MKKAPLPAPSDSSQQKNIAAVPLVPLDCHIFLRNEPHTGDFSKNIHRHHLLVYCISGRGCMTVDDVPFMVSAGEALLIAPGQLHRRVPLEKEKVQWLFIRFSLASEPEWLTLMCNRIFSFGEKENALLREFRDTCDRFHTAGESEPQAAECILRLALLLNALRSANGMNPASAGELPPAVKRLCRILVSVSGSRKNFNAIAREIGVSVGHLRMLFKQATGKTPSLVRNEERRRLAIHLLTHSRLNISEISRQLGFGSIYAFSRFFKQRTGVSPLKYRTGYLNGQELKD